MLSPNCTPKTKWRRETNCHWGGSETPVCQSKLPPATIQFLSFKPIQHGVDTLGGPELLAHRIQLLLQENQNGSLSKWMFQTLSALSRNCLLLEVSVHFPELYHHVGQMYGSSSSLIYGHGNDIKFQRGRASGRSPWPIPVCCCTSPNLKITPKEV